jgi:hypothetical protein
MSDMTSQEKGKICQVLEQRDFPCQLLQVLKTNLCASYFFRWSSQILSLERKNAAPEPTCPAPLDVAIKKKLVISLLIYGYAWCRYSKLYQKEVF